MNKNLTDLIAYLKSSAGCMGGNIDGEFWLFGIEYGGKAEVSDYQNLIPQDGHSCLTQAEMIELLHDTRTKFYLNIAKLLSVVFGRPITSFEDFARDAGIGTSKGEFYFGNVGAVGFSAEYNQEEFDPIGKYLGVESKDELKAIEAEVRSGLFQSWVKSHNPWCILCFGIGNAYRFIPVFSSSEEKGSKWSKVGRNNYYHELINDGKTHLFVLPHPSQSGPWCLTTENRINKFGLTIREMLLTDPNQKLDLK